MVYLLRRVVNFALAYLCDDNDIASIVSPKGDNLSASAGSALPTPRSIAQIHFLPRSKMKQDQIAAIAYLCTQRALPIYDLILKLNWSPEKTLHAVGLLESHGYVETYDNDTVVVLTKEGLEAGVTGLSNMLEQEESMLDIVAA